MISINYCVSCGLIFSFLVIFQVGHAYPEKLIDSKTGMKISLASLRFAFILARHGARSPLYTYPNDPFPFNDKRFWPQGKGELTNVGRSQFFKLGAKLRERYDGYLSLNYYPNDTFAAYNPADRNFDSASCLLASLYPPIWREVWNQQLRWQPIPFSIYGFDPCQLLKSGKCPAFAKEAIELAELYGTKEINKTSNIMKLVSKHTNESYKSIIQLLEITDTLTMQEENGYKTPDWADSVYPKYLREIEVNLMNALYGGSEKVISLTAGPELKHIGDLFIKKVNGVLAENSKMYIELGHDCIMYSLLKAMGSKYGLEKIESGAHLVFELHQVYSSFIVQVYYFKNPYDEKAKEIIITGCPSPCTLESFNTFITKTAGLNSWENACKL